MISCILYKFAYISPPLTEEQVRMDKGKKGTGRLSLYIQPSDFQRAVFLYRVFIFLQNNSKYELGIVLILAVH